MFQKWVKVVAFPTNDTKLVVRFLRKNIFAKFGTSRALVSATTNYQHRQHNVLQLPKMMQAFSPSSATFLLDPFPFFYQKMLLVQLGTTRIKC
ncbi:protein NYNRIN-like [Gossypium australe]|uniref:Protein NYNRIN-like n=1 Tax=Gossypium australe TaxID=47621 RepID=A0A5B6UY00_9ROSI|nr:protein NYNRIN-like [Gossypium australe]